MKEKFRHYYQPNEDVLKMTLNEAMVVLDTNVLLDFYSFGEQTKNDYYKVLGSYKAKNQIWLPHQVGFEFFENRIGIITKQLNQYDNIITYIESTEKKISELSNTSPSHSHLDFSQIASDYAVKVRPLKSKIERLKKNHPDYLVHDKVLDEIQNIYDDDLVGSEYDDVRLDEIIAAGEKRYEKNIPPGYEDKDKKESATEPSRNRKYGDLIMWMQIIDKARDIDKPVVLVTNDAKDDWVQMAKGGRKLGAKPALKREMLKECNVDFVLLSSDEFLDASRRLQGLTVDEDSVKEVKKYRELAVERTDAALLRRDRRARQLAAYGSELEPGYNRFSEPNDELQFLLDKCRRIIRNGINYSKEVVVPERLVRTLIEAEYVSRKMYRRSAGGLQIDITDYNELNALIVRVNHINTLNDNYISNILSDLFHIIDKMSFFITK